MKNTTKHILLHLMGWTFYILLQLLGTTEISSFFWRILVANNLPLIILFYASIFFLLPRFLGERKYFLLVISFVFLNLVAAFLRFFIIYIFDTSRLDDLLDAQLGPWFWAQFRVNVLFIGVSIAYWYARRTYEIEQNQQRLEKEVLDAQLTGLKNQINPHFLYNTLSFIYTKSLPVSKEVSAAIARLSEMMRYSLGEAAEDGFVPLDKEVNHLRNFIEIHQLRFNNRLAVNFLVEGDTRNHKIVPLLLITFVENAFKHGKTNDAGEPIDIRLHANNSSIEFDVANRKANGIKEKSSGIGILNTKNRLELAYPGKHELEIIDQKDRYAVHLKLSL